MENNPIENLMKTTLENIKQMVDVNTIVGNPIETKDGTTVIPISKVSFGFASGGSEFISDNDNIEDSNFPFGGGSGSGISIKPMAFLVLKDDSVRLLSLNQHNTYDKIIDSVPQILDMLRKKTKNEKKCNIKDEKAAQ